MQDDLNNNLSATERKALRAMAGMDVPSDLEDKTVAALTEQNLIRTRQGGFHMRVFGAIGVAAIIVLSFAGGFVVGKKKPLEIANASEFMLLLYQENDPNRIEAREDVSQEAYQVIVDKYRQWAEDRRAAGELVSAEKLEDNVLILTSDSRTTEFPAGRILGGYFLIRAENIEQAERLATTHPHLRYGGQIEVRPLDSQASARR